ncbi:LytR/AlgR family response regulator transcription factor [Crocinitomix catalasitica]|uniref:LytR/AlgR family response regulator transcription factor n=1 Tax=Crocinitomix catalasitica TaxID=184607 RepID=UPI000482844A|nr:LytTR family DNA-binding domain-containing protein [Crocinitomix catalasitica]|tara:strand:+ start:35 stop:721 length:687 start_codon:yes stop_codon:yes gene_type:complete
MLKVAILDDDKVSREIIKSYINFTDYLTLEVEFDNPLIALENIDKYKCDLIFLDIEMPQMNGIDFIEQAKNIPQVIIISSKTEYAAESYNYDVTDYLVKPIEYNRFIKAVKRVKEIKAAIALNESDDEQFIFVKSGTELIKLNFSSILYIEAFADYVQIYTADKRFTVLSTMKSILLKLGETEFARVHRSFIVAINKIEAMNEDGLKIGEKTIKVSRKYKKELKERLS